MTYKRTQIGWTTMIALGLGALVTWVAAPHTAGTLVVLGVLGVSLLVFSSLTVEGTDERLEVRFGSRLIRRRLDWAEIEAARPVRNSWLAGWGIRWIGSGWLFNVSGLDAVELSLRSGRRFRIGTDDPRGLHAFIARQLASSG